MELPPPQNHVFVDFENVHKVAPGVIGNKTATFTLLVGAKQTKLDVTLVEQLLANASSVELVRLTSSGRNALDFALAYYVGRAVAADPTGTFHIIAKDKGYDALVEHLRNKNIHVHRHADFSALTFSGPEKPGVRVQPNGASPAAPPPNEDKTVSPAITSSEYAEKFLKHLATHPHNRPKRRATLLRHIKTHLGNKPTDAEADKVIRRLTKDGHIELSDKGAIQWGKADLPIS